MKGKLRKIVVGDSYSFCIKYVIGSEYRIGAKKCKLVDFIVTPNEGEPDSIDIYVSDGDSTFCWKTIDTKPLEKEYDANFS